MGAHQSVGREFLEAANPDGPREEGDQELGDLPTPEFPPTPPPLPPPMAPPAPTTEEPTPYGSYVRRCTVCGELAYFRERICLNLSFMGVPDLNVAKNWAGQPPSNPKKAAEYMEYYRLHPKKPKKNRGLKRKAWWAQHCKRTKSSWNAWGYRNHDDDDMDGGDHAGPSGSADVQPIVVS
ncbi:unnamed protein product [Symbiodinium sp. CCMP2592]|nr:unnamed protein product [Symbiodinium sp. CCMP2592]